eukprot:1180268-Prorocentrum_minimum.AAC.1
MHDDQCIPQAGPADYSRALSETSAFISRRQLVSTSPNALQLGVLFPCHPVTQMCISSGRMM